MTEQERRRGNLIPDNDNKKIPTVAALPRNDRKRKDIRKCTPIRLPLVRSKACKRRQWRMQRAGLGAAVEKIEDQRKPEDFFRYRKSSLSAVG